MNKIDLSTVRMGSDAEVFCVDATGRFFPVCGLIKGTKDNPRKLTDDGIAVQEDNVMLEFNTAVSSNRKEWVENIRKAYRLAAAELPPGFTTAAVPSAHFETAFLQTPQAQMFGCEPDYNAWTMERNRRPQSENPNLRTAAAHVHISWANPENMEQRQRVIQMADIFVVLPSIRTQSKEAKARREMYGKAGAFRPKEYGVEHRVLDNSWIADGVWIDAVWRRYTEAIMAANTDFVIPDDLASEVQRCINEGDGKASHKLYHDLYYRIYPQEKESLKMAEKNLQYIISDSAGTSTRTW